ncbi:hypothetical protein [Hydrogenophaga pseudoflava]|uniref:hypothetical protein n=1 Tax=Hydrogenophaga pseudoflava TaxID=47421 RepID=UPI0027E4A087|nr:hypothetical protein [Hydrogenophaga pseudoflava]MDQ7745072.1 hypothetical protein [Hydrogenophaga pseudoflava]
MKTSSVLIALVAGGSLLTACDRTTPTPPVSTAPPPASAPATTDPSVPPAASVIPPGSVAKEDPALGQTDGNRKPAQESDTKLLPGQNNDHSAPLGTAR